MTFECQSVWNWDDIDELTEKYPCLKDYGIKSVVKTSLKGYEYTRLEIEINSLEELMELSRKVGLSLIIKPDEPCIEIYDNYRE